MVEKEFQLDSYIIELSNVLEWRTLEGLMKYINYKDSQGAFEAAAVIGDMKGSERIESHIRDTKNLSLNNTGDSMTDIHWSNYLYHNFFKALEIYKKHFPYCVVERIIDIQILKYDVGGHYQLHTDDHPGPGVTRTLSFIFRLNNDYEGGDLVWKANNKEFYRSKTKPNSMVVWPSNFQYPHGVEPVTKGRRWSIVAWAR